MPTSHTATCSGLVSQVDNHIIYNAREVSAAANVARVKAWCDANGLAWQEEPVENPAEAADAVRALAPRCDAMFLPADNTVSSEMETLTQICNQANVPCFGAYSFMVEKGALLSVSANAVQLGHATADIADLRLKGTPAAKIPVREMTAYTTYLNLAAAQQLGIVFSDAMLDDTAVRIVE